MTVVTVTRLGARSPEALDEVLALTTGVLAQLETAPGFLGGRLLLESGSAWTLTVFADVAALRAFAVAHAPVSQQGPRLADVLQSTAWRRAGDGVPTWDEAAGRWPHGDGPQQAAGLSADLPPARVPVGA